MSLVPPPKDRAFEAKRQEWIRCFGSEDRNSVMRQVYSIVWNAGAYRVVLEARRIADKDEKGRIKLNGLTHQLLDRCFYQSQLVSIRRLMDKQPKDPKKHVFSLRGLVLDMRDNRAMFTRQNLFAAFERPLDVEAVRRAMVEHLWERGRQGHEVSTLPATLVPDIADRLHKDLDALCGVSAGDRRETDVVAEAVFSKLETKLAATETICKHVDKFLAHAATPESRALVDADAAKITFAELWGAHEIICRTCQFLDSYLLRQMTHSFLASSPADLFRYADQPLATADRIPALREEWRSYAKETASWSEGSMEWALAAVPPNVPGVEGEDAPPA